MPRDPSILVADSDPAVRLLIRRALTAAGYRVHDIEPAKASVGLFAERQFDLMILDFDVPAGDARDTIRSVRELSTIPIVALSVRGDEDTTVDALDSGADDYIRKPFGTKELVARVKNALRRRALQQGKSALLVGADLEIDLIHRRVRSRGGDVHLARKPYEVLRVLAEDAGKVITHETILRTVWGERSLHHIAYLRVAIRVLRRRLEPDPAHPRHIITEPRVGYRLVVGVRPERARLRHEASLAARPS